MNRTIRKALWAWLDWRNRRKLPDIRSRRRSIIKRKKQHAKYSPLIKEQQNQMLELLGHYDKA